MSISKVLIQPPSWLDHAFVENSLRKGFERNNLKILEYDMNPATAPGENYASLIFRCNLTVTGKNNNETEKLSLIVKVIPTGTHGEELIKLRSFEIETEAFVNTLPAIESYLSRVYSDHERLSAECYYFQGPPNDLLILEDLKKSGFVLTNRIEMLDMDHSILVLKNMAKLHAASLMVMKENSNAFKAYECPFFLSRELNVTYNLYEKSFTQLAEDVLTWPDLKRKEIYAEKFKKLEQTAIDDVQKVWARDNSKLNVYVHGDTWTNNFMFRYDSNGKVNGMKFVDFQLSKVNSPVLDLLYFIFSSVKLELRFSKIDLLLKIYHSTFEETLNKLNYQLEKPYGFEQLKKDFEDKYLWGFMVTCCTLPLFILPHDDAFDGEAIFKEGYSESATLYKNDKIRKVLGESFHFFEEKGVF